MKYIYVSNEKNGLDFKKKFKKTKKNIVLDQDYEIEKLLFFTGKLVNEDNDENYIYEKCIIKENENSFIIVGNDTNIINFILNKIYGNINFDILIEMKELLHLYDLKYPKFKKLEFEKMREDNFFDKFYYLTKRPLCKLKYIIFNKYGIFIFDGTRLKNISKINFSNFENSILLCYIFKNNDEYNFILLDTIFLNNEKINHTRYRRILEEIIGKELDLDSKHKIIIKMYNSINNLEQLKLNIRNLNNINVIYPNENFILIPNTNYRENHFYYLNENILDNNFFTFPKDIFKFLNIEKLMYKIKEKINIGSYNLEVVNKENYKISIIEKILDYRVVNGKRFVVIILNGKEDVYDLDNFNIAFGEKIEKPKINFFYDEKMIYDSFDFFKVPPESRISSLRNDIDINLNFNIGEKDILNLKNIKVFHHGFNGEINDLISYLLFEKTGLVKKENLINDYSKLYRLNIFTLKLKKIKVDNKNIIVKYIYSDYNPLFGSIVLLLIDKWDFITYNNKIAFNPNYGGKLEEMLLLDTIESY